MKILIYGNEGCGKCYNQFRAVREQLIAYHDVEKINCSDLTDEEMAELNIRNIPVTMIYDGDTLVARFNEIVTPQQIKDKISSYKK